MAIIREYQSKDIPAIAEFQRQLNEEHLRLDQVYYKPSASASKEFSDYLLKKINDEDFKIFVAEENKPVGYIMGWIETRPPIYANRKIGYLSNIYVAPEHRGTHLGKELEGTLCKWFISKGISYVRLTADLRNKNAVETFKNMGFMPVIVEMKKELKK